jgi:hypothetical protein
MANSASGLFKPREDDVKTHTQDSSAHGTGLNKVAGSRFGVDGTTAARTISGLIPVLLPGIQTKAADHASIGHAAHISRRGLKECLRVCRPESVRARARGKEMKGAEIFCICNLCADDVYSRNQ